MTIKKLLRTVDFLDMLKTEIGLPSDYALSHVLGVTRQQISRYRNGHDFFSEEVCMKAAAHLRLDAAYVLTCIAAERAKCTPAKEALETLAKKLAALGLAVGLGFGAGAVPEQAHAGKVSNINYTKQRRKLAAGAALAV